MNRLLEEQPSRQKASRPVPDRRLRMALFSALYFDVHSSEAHVQMRGSAYIFARFLLTARGPGSQSRLSVAR